jgi:hypothetical protein
MPPSLITNLNIVQWPSTFPNVGGLYGKNTVVTDPNFGSKIVRATDASSGSGGYQSMQTGDAAQKMMWNSNDTLFFARNTDATDYLFQFNPTTLQATQLPYSTQNSTAFSMTEPGVIFELNGPVITKVTFTLVSGVWTYNSSAAFADYSNGGLGGIGYLPAGYTVNWTGAFTHSNDDGTFTVAFSQGTQDTGFYVCCYQVGSGYRILDTQTGIITGQWGATGLAVLENWQGITGGSPNSFPFDLHETYQAQNPAYAHVTAYKAVGGNPLIWTIAGLTLSGIQQGGHCAQAWSNDYTAGYGGGQCQGYPYTNTTNPHFIMDVPPNTDQLPADQTPKQHYTGDMHHGLPWLGNNNDDALLVTTNGPPTVVPFTSCWMGEVRLLDITGTISGTQGTMYRACHTFNSGKSQTFIIQNAIGCVSQTGNFVAFASDWAGSSTVSPLGSTSGAPTGTVGVDGRGDVFIVAIPFGDSAPVITSANSTTFTEGVLGTFQVNTTGFPTPAISETGSLPSGVTFVDNGNGTATLSGTATASGTFPLVITATNSVGTVTQNFTLTVTAVSPGIAPQITSADHTTFSKGTFGSFAVDTTGTPTPAITESGSLPGGVSFVDNGNGTGTLSGTATGVGTFHITFTAANGVTPNAVQHFTLTIADPVPAGTVTGTFQFPTGTPVANGKYQFKLSADAVKISVACNVPTLVSGTLDANGNLNTSLTFNDELQTVFGLTTTYQLTIKDVAGRQVWNEKYYLTGTAANLNTITPTGGASE